MIKPSNLYQRLIEGLRGGTAQTKQASQTGLGEVWVVADTNWSNLITPAEMETMGAICPPRPYRKNESIYRTGDAAESLYIVLEGSVKLSLSANAGRERIVAVCGPDDFFGESFLTGARVRKSEAVCLSDRTVVCPISKAQFLEVSHQVPGVAVSFAGVLAERVQTLEQQLELMTLPAQARLGRCLILLAQRFGTQVSPGVMTLNLGLKHEDLASLAATTRVSATQAMSQWRALELIEGTRGEYTINVSGLERLVEGLVLEHMG